MKKLISIITLTAMGAVAHGADHIEVSGQIKQYSPKADIHIYDASYTSVNERELSFIIADHFGMIRRYATLVEVNEQFDCDDYAFTFKSIVSCYGSLFGSNYECGVITVKQVKGFGGVPAGGYHALNIILLDGVLNVLEPQTYQFAPLSEYPNRDNILGLVL